VQPQPVQEQQCRAQYEREAEHRQAGGPGGTLDRVERELEGPVVGDVGALAQCPGEGIGAGNPPVLRDPAPTGQVQPHVHVDEAAPGQCGRQAEEHQR
jgi:hypothetical protein